MLSNQIFQKISSYTKVKVTEKNMYSVELKKKHYVT